MPYTYECRNGHANGCWPEGEGAAASAAGLRECSTCALSLRLKHYSPIGTSTILPVIHSHYNRSFGEVVTGRTHLRELRKIHGTSAFEPTAKGKEWIKQSEEKLRAARR